MDLKDIQNLIKFVAKSGASEVKLEMEDVKITIRTGSEKPDTTIIQQAPIASVPAQIQTPPAPVQEEPTTSTKSVSDKESKYVVIKSPIIGTFYRKPS
ncbi:MAG: acetyl-CoA carboxylase, biotin carboxyl carrier protein, partial [Bacteroidia bacterium]|nr:acetyl-CoA carboxylase, biotin carboxyl carrier protein [Bacteroidia bacterium]